MGSLKTESDPKLFIKTAAAAAFDMFAAEADGQAAPPEYQIISGTSMSSPHNAGSGALMSAVQPDWTPYEIKSALMMTAKRLRFSRVGLMK